MSELEMMEAHIEVAGYIDEFIIRGIDIDVNNGEVLVVTGPSGSGKTTLAKALTGLLGRSGDLFKGSILINGYPLLEMPFEKIYKLVTYIPQEPWYALVGYTVYAEHCLILSQLGLKCSSVFLEKLGLADKIDSLTINLSAGETQRLLWAEALAKKSSVLILDEPLVYLDREARRIVADVVRDARDNGASIIIIDHDPLFWRELAGKLLVLENGVAKYYGEWDTRVLQQSYQPSKTMRVVNDEVAVDIENIWFKYPGEKPLFRGLSLQIKKSLITGLTGRNGAGKSTLLKLIAGILKPTKGFINRHGTPVYIPENPLLYFTKPTPREELLYMANGREEKVLETAEIFDISRILDTPLARLSSGERRRLALASAYLGGFDIYLIDEPTGGLDQANATRVLEALLELVNEGRTVVVATHDERVIKLLDYEFRMG
ncbi:ATP-binding cassette domain-containing protein [Desulfurococcus amylolyticus]|nr:ATP-binding cassette domain-containing protein [Desulfurococcus amylolyticus]